MDISKRVYVEEAKKKSKALVAGWVEKIKVLGNIAFITLRDNSGKLQIVANKDFKGFKELSKITKESVIVAFGQVKKGKLKSGEKEMILKELEVMNKADPVLPIEIFNETTGIDKRLDNRSLDIRNPKVKAIFKIQGVIIQAFREFFYDKKFIEIQPPGIIGVSTEGGTNLFKAKYFDKDVYLAQSPQLYKQFCAISWEKVFSVSPVWRAEKHNTSRHLNEARQLDIEMTFEDQFGVMKYLEKVMEFIVKKVLKECKQEIKLLGLKLKVPKGKYLSYKETVELLIKKGIKIKYGDDLEPEAEKKLSELFKDNIIFIHSWPNKLKPFYIWPLDKEISGGFDAIYNGVEISSGGQRVHDPEVLIKKLKEKGLKPASFKWYVDSFRYGAPIHSGWSIGLERVTMGICDLDNVREACLFPRDRDRVSP